MTTTPRLVERRYLTPNGKPAIMHCRSDTVDHVVVESVFGSDEYGFKGRSWTGTALDVGAHIGSAAIALALDNPDLHVIAIEPVYENADLIGLNVEANDLEDRITVRSVAVSDHMGEDEVAYDFEGDEFVRHNRFIGNLWRPSNHPHKTQWVKTIDLHSIVLGIPGRITLIKTDCEGGEWRFLSSPDVDFVDEIIGEYHDRPWPAIADLLGATHTTTRLKDEGGFGLFRAVHH